MSEPTIDPDAPTPWVMCPECGGTWLRIVAVLERGKWNDDDVYEPSDTPRVSSYVAGDHGEAIECRDCGHKFDVAGMPEVDPS
jgi:DNA-directed RNA polymerase subunit RPC12/RpoP